MHVQCVLPANAPQAGAVLYFFGGGYVEGSPNEDLAITARLAAALGRRIYVPYYRLAPEHPAPAALGDALAVYRALLTRVPADALAVAGESAGGGLALSLLIEAAAARLAMPAVLTLALALGRSLQDRRQPDAPGECRALHELRSDSQGRRRGLCRRPGSALTGYLAPLCDLARGLTADAHYQRDARCLPQRLRPALDEDAPGGYRSGAQGLGRAMACL